MSEIPYDVEAERSLLGSCILDRSAIRAVRGLLAEQDFYLQKHGRLWIALCDLSDAGTPPDLTTVVARLRERGWLDEVGGIFAISEMAASVPTAVHVEYYGRIVKRHALRRNVIALGEVISALGYDQSREYSRLRSEIEERIRELGNDGSTPPVISAVDLMKMEIPPVRWIIPQLLSEGFGFLAASPGAGKTWMLLQWALAVASGGMVFGKIPVAQQPVLFFALEDTHASLQERLRILLGPDGRLPPNLFFVTDGCEPAPEHLGAGFEQQLEDMVRATGAGLVIIDTLTSVSSNGGRRSANAYVEDYQRYTGIRSLASRYNIAVIGTWHFNKGQEGDVLRMVSGTMGLPAVSVNRMGFYREDDSSFRFMSHSKRGASVDHLLSFDRATCQWVVLGDTNEVRRSKSRDQIIEMLAQQSEPVAVREIVDALNANYNNVVQLLKSMKESGEVVSPSRGKYALHDRVSQDHEGDHEAIPDSNQPNSPAHRLHDRHDRDSAIMIDLQNVQNSDHDDHEGFFTDGFPHQEAVQPNFNHHDPNFEADHEGGVAIMNGYSDEQVEAAMLANPATALAIMNGSYGLAVTYLRHAADGERAVLAWVLQEARAGRVLFEDRGQRRLFGAAHAR